MPSAEASSERRGVVLQASQSLLIQGTVRVKVGQCLLPTTSTGRLPRYERCLPAQHPRRCSMSISD